MKLTYCPASIPARHEGRGIGDVTPAKALIDDIVWVVV